MYPLLLLSPKSLHLPTDQPSDCARSRLYRLGASSTSATGSGESVNSPHISAATVGITSKIAASSRMAAPRSSSSPSCRRTSLRANFARRGAATVGRDSRGMRWGNTTLSVGARWFRATTPVSGAGSASAPPFYRGKTWGSTNTRAPGNGSRARVKGVRCNSFGATRGITRPSSRNATRSTSRRVWYKPDQRHPTHKDCRWPACLNPPP